METSEHQFSKVCLALSLALVAFTTCAEEKRAATIEQAFEELAKKAEEKRPGAECNRFVQRQIKKQLECDIRNGEYTRAVNYCDLNSSWSSQPECVKAQREMSIRMELLEALNGKQISSDRAMSIYRSIKKLELELLSDEVKLADEVRRLEKQRPQVVVVEPKIQQEPVRQKPRSIRCTSMYNFTNCEEY